MTRSKLAISLLSASALALSLAACGGDDGDNDGDSGTPGLFGEGIDEDSSDDVADADEDSQASDEDPDTAGEYCALVQDYLEKSAQMQSDEVDLDDFHALVDNEISNIAAAAPDGMADTWQEHGEVLIEFMEITFEDYTSRYEGPVYERFQQGLEQITDNVKQECGFTDDQFSDDDDEPLATSGPDD